MLENWLKFFWKRKKGCVWGMSIDTGPLNPPGGHPALSPNKNNDLESIPLQIPPCSVIPLLNIILLSIDIISLLSPSICLIWI